MAVVIHILLRVNKLLVPLMQELCSLLKYHVVRNAQKTQEETWCYE